MGKTVNGLLADINVIGYVHSLARLMKEEPWKEFWDALHLTLYELEELRLTRTSSDREIWEACQKNSLILITDNRNEESPDSMAATIKRFNQPHYLPIVTISDLDKLRNERQYVDRVIEKLFEYLLFMDDFRGTGRLFVP